jgi:hypothetical protein
MSGASGPLDPWGGGRQGEPVTSRPLTHTLKTPFVARTTTPQLPDMPDMPNTAAPWQVDEPGSADHFEPPASRSPAASHDDAWLRETGALSSMGGAMGGGEPAAHTHTPSSETEPWAYQQERRQPSYDERDGWRAEPPQQQRPAPRTPPGLSYQPAYQPPIDDHWAANQRWGAGAAGSPDERYEADYQPEEEEPTSEVEAAPPTPWRDDGWQPPILPRFGPKRDEPPDQR